MIKNNLNIHIFNNSEQIAKAAAAIVTEQVLSNPNLVLGLATGATPLEMYSELINLYKKGVLSFSNIKTFNLDEYIGLSKKHPQSYYQYMVNNLFSHVDISLDNAYLPNGLAKDLEQECKNYENMISAAGGIDLQILGIGRNGHIGFNEPSNIFQTRTHIVELSEDTLKANAYLFDNNKDMPHTAITMGIGTIARAKRILLIAKGVSKAEAIAKMINGNIDPYNQASILQIHPNVTVLLDRDAASQI